MSPARRVVYLYSHLLVQLRQAARYLETGEVLPRNQAAVKAREIVGELLFSLDFDAGGEIAANLGRLYEFLIWELTQFEFHPDRNRLAKATTIVSTLHEAWEGAARQVAELPAPTAGVGA